MITPMLTAQVGNSFFSFQLLYVLHHDLRDKFVIISFQITILEVGGIPHPLAVQKVIQHQSFQTPQIMA